jgi:hypothetical protein
MHAHQVSFLQLRFLAFQATGNHCAITRDKTSAGAPHHAVVAIRGALSTVRLDSYMHSVCTFALPSAR